MTRADLDAATLDAAERLVRLWEAEERAASESCRGSAATATAAPVRAELRAAEQMLAACVRARRTR